MTVLMMRAMLIKLTMMTSDGNDDNCGATIDLSVSVLVVVCHSVCVSESEDDCKDADNHDDHADPADDDDDGWRLSGNE